MAPLFLDLLVVLCAGGTVKEEEEEEEDELFLFLSPLLLLLRRTSQERRGEREKGKQGTHQHSKTYITQALCFLKTVADTNLNVVEKRIFSRNEIFALLSQTSRTYSTPPLLLFPRRPARLSLLRAPFGGRGGEAEAEAPPHDRPIEWSRRELVFIPSPPCHQSVSPLLLVQGGIVEGEGGDREATQTCD